MSMDNVSQLGWDWKLLEHLSTKEYAATWMGSGYTNNEMRVCIQNKSNDDCNREVSRLLISICFDLFPSTTPAHTVQGRAGLCFCISSLIIIVVAVSVDCEACILIKRKASAARVFITRRRRRCMQRWNKPVPVFSPSSGNKKNQCCVHHTTRNNRVIT